MSNPNSPPDVAQARATVNARRDEWRSALTAESKARQRAHEIAYGIARCEKWGIAEETRAKFLAADAEWMRLADLTSALFGAYTDATGALDAAKERQQAADLVALRRKLTEVAA